MEQLDEAMIAWMRSQAADGCSGNTIRQRHDIVRRTSEACEADPRWLTLTQLQDYLARPGLMPASRSTYTRQLRSFYRWLQDSGRRPDNPMTDIRTTRVPRSAPRPISRADLTLALAHADGDLRAWLLLASRQGLRVHEVAKVRGEDIDGDDFLVDGKGGVRAVLPLHPEIRALARWYPSAGYWFPASKRSSALPHISPTWITTSGTEHLHRLGIRSTMHKLRGRYITDVLEAADGDPFVARTLARHASVSTTQLYVDVPEARRREVAERMLRLAS